MKFFKKFEQKYRNYAIRNLMYYIVIMYGVGIVIQLMMPAFYYQFLSLDAGAILRGQVWRIVTFMLYPPFMSGSIPSMIMFGMLAMYLYYSLGTTLERVWGSFRFNVYFFMGVIGHVAAALVGRLVFKQDWLLTTEFLNFSLFFAFALTFPDVQFLLMYIIPVKAKWMAMAQAAVYVYYLIFGGASMRCEILMSMLNVILFFFLTRDYSKINPKEIKRKRDFQTQIKMMPKGRTHHKCAVCGKTEEDGVDLEFRYCSKCQGSYEYCQEHLYTHKHVDGEEQNQTH